MTPKERAVKALTLKVPDMVPTFELDFQIEEEMFGSKFITEEGVRVDGFKRKSFKDN
jgi:uroporphyrinogen decarboxylase